MSIFLVILNFSAALAMISSSQYPIKKDFYKQSPSLAFTLLHTRLNNTSRLLLKDVTFNVCALPIELQKYIAAISSPDIIQNLSKTCTNLHNQLSFQTPYVWDIICHSLHCVSTKNMPKLLLKAHLCKKDDIKQKILAIYTCSIDDHPFLYYSRCGGWYGFIPFCSDNKSLEEYSSSIDTKPTPLMLASRTDDIRIITDIMNNIECTDYDSGENRPLLIAISNQLTNSIRLLCSTLKKGFNDNSPYNGQLYCDTAMHAKKIKSFEALIIFYKDYLNKPNHYNETYLDYLNSIYCSPTFSAYLDIVKKHGGITNKQPGLLERCVIQ